MCIRETVAEWHRVFVKWNCEIARGKWEWMERRRQITGLQMGTQTGHAEEHAESTL